MKSKSICIFAFLSVLLLLPACSDVKLTNDLYDDWWPVHASGSYDDNRFTARWDGDLGIHGDIKVNYVNKNNASLSYDDVVYYPMVSFSKKRKAFCTVTLQSLGDMRQSKYLKFEVKDGKLFYEKSDERGKGTGEFGEGQDLNFLSGDVVRIGNITYERYSYFKTRHPEIFKELAALGFDPDFLPIIPATDD